ncbi:hypothetical protein CJ030_MR4G016054 [Morella rubra]|uniref:Protein kinase domain-containing protein n=1 Tax=Morella rubra TaxID=262757 RepID=A0A6A1VVW7_9ROSI|nr:hypothetical protein CJ030_MR4G016054 [Morella rubra]
MAELPVVFIFAFCAACFFGMIELAQAQNVTDPVEARVLNSMFQQWGLKAPSGKWNISGKLCSGQALASNTIETLGNPFIKCDCSDKNQSTCHITELRVYAMDVKGVIPEDLWTLTFLTNLNLARNYLTGNLSSSIGNLTRMQRLEIGHNSLSGELPKELGNLTDLRFLKLIQTCVYVGMAELLGMDARPFTFSYAELKTATGDFNPANKLGEGGFGPVYKGTLNDGRVIAVKQLSVASHQGKNQFIAEIATISAVQHRNLVKLYGCCLEGDQRLLVYEFLENKSLDQALFARGLAYLHEESRLRIVHRDVKASNILLDSNLIPKISDFGLAKLYDDKKTHISTRVAGTIGYLAPEYAMRGHLTEKADVFAFGVVALEVVSGRSNCDSTLEEEKIYLLEWAWHLHENNCEADLLDTTLSDINEEEMKRVIGVSLLCTQASPLLRPSMSRVVAMLSGDIEVSTVTSRPGYLTDWKFDDSTGLISDFVAKGTDTSYINSSSSTSIVGNAENSPMISPSQPMLRETVDEGR